MLTFKLVSDRRFTDRLIEGSHPNYLQVFRHCYKDHQQLYIKFDLKNEIDKEGYGKKNNSKPLKEKVSVNAKAQIKLRKLTQESIEGLNVKACLPISKEWFATLKTYAKQ